MLNKKNIKSFILIGIFKKLVWVLVIYTTTVFAQQENKYIRSGNDYYEEENYKEAEVDYMKALEKSPESYKGQYNLGGALYKQENFEDASKLYNNLASRDVDDNERADAFYNLGNSMLKAEKYQESIEFYKNSLRLNPGDMDTKYNLEYAKKMMQQQQEQEQDQDKDKEDKEDEKKDQEKKEQKKQDQEQKEQEQKEQEQDQQQDQPSDKQQQPQPQQISKQDAERMLEALKNDENKTLEKINLQKMQQGKAKKVEKDW